MGILTRVVVSAIRKTLVLIQSLIFVVASNVTWPAYTLDDASNLVFDTNVTDLAYVSPDLFRAEAIEYLSTAVLTDLAAI